MQIFIENQFGYIFFSAVIGIIMGIAYDLLFLFPTIFLKKSGSLFICDFIFMLIWGLSMITVAYDKNFGSYRWYSFASSGTLFYLYRISIGKVILKAESFVINSIYNFLIIIITKTVKLLDFFVKFVKINIDEMSTKRYIKRLFEEAKINYKRKEQYEKRSNKT